MLNRFARALFTRLLTPVARVLLAAGISPDVVTLVGTLGVCFGALFFYPRGDFLIGTLVITAFVFSDTVDGIMARASGRSSAWGAFLDSTLDRLGDASIFGGLVLYFAGGSADASGGGEGGGRDAVMAGLALACLVLGQVVSYSRARAEGLGMRADVGIAERSERLVTVLLFTGLTGLFKLPIVVLGVVLGLLAVASAVTVAQRMLMVRRQVLAQHRAAQAVSPGTGGGGDG
jgi:CDP-diacylglycerol---glycerol-3-phosphate 3-phosphatidyltransferase